MNLSPPTTTLTKEMLVNMIEALGDSGQCTECPLQELCKQEIDMGDYKTCYEFLNEIIEDEG